MSRILGLLGVLALVLALSGTASAWQCPDPSDFLTGGGFILVNGEHANFAIGGACKKGGDGHGLWGHLEFHDHGTGLNAHWTTITGYFSDFILGDPQARIICGTARTNQFGDVNFAVRATDHGEPGVGVDEFDIWLTDPSTGDPDYASADDGTFPHTLAGGNIQLHKPIKTTTTFAESCPALGINS